MQLVIVESPAKSRTINKYLGKDYKVLASYGHIRDLPSKDGSVLPEEDFAMTYEVSPDKKKRLKEIADAAKLADSILLATDPDREGEAISWHLVEALRNKRIIKKDTPVKRVVFNEITKNAVLKAMENPREMDMDLVNAQQARRALDYLVGFNLSPVLWRKLPGSKSAGRVQSVALRLICERENEIEQFKSQEYWTIEGVFDASGKPVNTRLTHLDGKKCEKFDIADEASAKAIVKRLQTREYHVESVTPKQVKRRPQAPFTTSTLQQEASRKLGFGAKRTMQVAQKLYEGIELGGGDTTGLITYMRTDGVFVSKEAIAETRKVVEKQFGGNFLPEKPKFYSSKAKNAQEAHEAIRPTSIARSPESLKSYLDQDQLKLYTLIWKRMVASQMADAQLEQVSVDILSDDKSGSFRATGSVVKFPGFLKLYREDRDDGKDENAENLLPELKKNQKLPVQVIDGEQHFTEPPPRYSEASLVKKLEELGIGRPSTYASIISVLQDRDYVTLDKKRFIPQERGRIVTTFLEQFFTRYVEYDFTANLEDSLDQISAGNTDWKAVLHSFWDAFKVTVDAAHDLAPPDILREIEKALAFHIFPEGKRNCPSCDDGTLELKAGKFGPFLGCSNYPECRYTKPLASEEDADAAKAEGEFPKELGTDQATGHAITLRSGPYGLYVQLEDGEKKPKRSAIPKGTDPQSVDLDMAIELLSLPKTIGDHPEDGKPVKVGIGRYGPYVQHEKTYASIPVDEDIFSIGMNRAVSLLADKKAGGKKANALKELGEHPQEGGMVAVYSGRYGPYVKHGKLNASLPKNVDPETLGMEQAIELLEKKKAAPTKPKRKRA